ncbi:hypothetical protein CEP51_013210 [Fusarium floridanum]|uniref:Uncharacterized protein n=1 Tax=Fusarium floridanum TaxID=1325733 RepID=A0A428QFD0_9HYPO|nr:hypothetical protein CEP51_013210 [Fusarium floridanum]
MTLSTPSPQYISLSPQEALILERTPEPDTHSISSWSSDGPPPSSSSPTTPVPPNDEFEAAHSFIHSWWLELVALCVCLGSFSGLLYLLLAYDGKPISEWTQFPLSLNALVSILSGISRASLAFVISMCLSQAKWNWATRYIEPLVDFERFDAASRGPWGSLRLMRSFLRRPHWAALGGFTSIVLLAYEPLIQAILTLEDQPTVVSSTDYGSLYNLSNPQNTNALAEIARSSFLDTGFWSAYSNVRGLGRIEFPGPDGKKLFYQSNLVTSAIQDDMGLAAAIWSGFSPLVKTQNLWPAFTCTTGNCSWDNYASLAVCSSCLDLSERIKKSTRIITVSEVALPGTFGDDAPDVSNKAMEANMDMGGQRISITKHKIPEVELELSNYHGKPRCPAIRNGCPDTYLTAKVTTNPGHTVSFGELDTMLLAVQFLQANESWQNNQSFWEDTTVTSHECSLYFCVNEYEAVVEEGILHEKVVSSWKRRNRPSYHNKEVEQFFDYANETLDMDGAWIDHLSDLQIAVIDENYNSRSKNLSQVSFNITEESIVSVLKNLKDGFTLQDCLSGPNCTAKSGRYIYPGLGGPKPPGLMTGLGETGNITLTFENVALSLTKWMRDREFSSSSTASGNATTTIVITHVQWEFLGFPAATLAVGIIFAALSIWDTQRIKRRAWKDSALATLAHAPAGAFKANLQAAAATGKIAEIGKASEITMQYRDGLGQLELTSKEDRPRLS